MLLSRSKSAVAEELYAQFALEQEVTRVKNVLGYWKRNWNKPLHPKRKVAKCA